ncbi:hypothetical protein DFAR_2090022 [Desulfarculales bacterium]
MVAHPSPQETGIIPCHMVAIILFVAACVKKIMELGRSFPWPWPKRCSRCRSVRLWRHDFVPAYFDEAPTAIWLRRSLCPACRAVDPAAAAGLLELVPGSGGEHSAKPFQ